MCMEYISDAVLRQPCLFRGGIRLLIFEEGDHLDNVRDGWALFICGLMHWFFIDTSAAIRSISATHSGDGLLNFGMLSLKRLDPLNGLDGCLHIQTSIQVTSRQRLNFDGSFETFELSLGECAHRTFSVRLVGSRSLVLRNRFLRLLLGFVGLFDDTVLLDPHESIHHGAIVDLAREESSGKGLYLGCSLVQDLLSIRKCISPFDSLNGDSALLILILLRLDGRLCRYLFVLFSVVLHPFDDIHHRLEILFAIQVTPDDGLDFGDRSVHDVLARGDVKRGTWVGSTARYGSVEGTDRCRHDAAAVDGVSPGIQIRVVAGKGGGIRIRIGTVGDDGLRQRLWESEPVNDFVFFHGVGARWWLVALERHHDILLGRRPVPLLGFGLGFAILVLALLLAGLLGRLLTTDSFGSRRVVAIMIRIFFIRSFMADCQTAGLPIELLPGLGKRLADPAVLALQTPPDVGFGRLRK
mmetsp:Transcript_10398/g.29657  ORF Transcript_10398/g.29657 Transcript_10398/m.29657 type:complete len:468 (+) Transcript_10398:874-2277(+)